MATSYTGLRVQDTYNAIIKIGDNSNLSATPKLLSDGVGNDTPLYLSGTRLGIGITPAYQFHTSGNAKIGGNLIISGNLTVNGTLTYLNVEDLAVEDPIIKLAKDNTANTLDIGLFGKYVATGTKYKGFFNDASDDKFKLFIGTTVEPTTTVDTSASGYTVGTLVANLEGNVTGNADTATGVLITADSTDTSRRMVFTESNNATDTNASLFKDSASDFFYNPSTNILTVGTVSGSLSGNADTSTGVLITADNANSSRRMVFTESTNDTDTDGRLFKDSSADFFYNPSSNTLTLVNLTGTTGNFSGQVTIPETPTADGHAASKKYVDDQIADVDTAKRLEVTVKNVSGAELAKGVVVHASPTATPPSGNVIEVIAADANDAAKMPSIGVLNETIADEAEGEAVMFGTVQGIDTSGFSIGDELYVSTTAGELTATKPTANDELVQKVAIVIKSHESNGLIKVFGAGRANDVPNQIDRNVNFTDNSKLTFGDSTSPDFKIYHEGTDSIIQNYTGSIYIDNNADDQDIVFRSDDGSGGIIEYFRVDGSTNTVPFGRSPHIVDNVKLYFGNDTANDASIKWDSTASQLFIDGVSKFLSNVYFTGNAYFGDNDKLYFGDLTTPDLEIYHDGTNSVINNKTGDLQIYNNADDKDIVFLSDNGSGGTATYYYLDGSEQLNRFLKNILIPDNVSLSLGNSFDLKLYHDETNSHIINTTGDLTIDSQGDDLILKAADDALLYVQGTDIAIQAVGDGKVGLRYNNVEKLATTTTGAVIYEDLLLSGTTPFLSIDGSTNAGIQIHSPSGAKINMDSRDSGDGAMLHKWNRNSDDDAYLPYYENWYDGDSYQSIGVESNLWRFSHGLVVTGGASFTGNVTATASNATISASESGGATTKIMGASVGRVGTSSDHELEILSNNTAALTIDTSQNATFSGDISIPVAKSLYFGGGSHTYIKEDIDDRLRFFVGGAEFMRFTEDTSDTINFYKDATFAGDVTIGINDFTAGTVTIGGILLQNSADRSGLLEINKKGTSTWTGIQIVDGAQFWSLMGNTTDVGLYDDTNGKWAFLYNINSSLELRHNGTTKITTTGAGAEITGNLVVSDNAYLNTTSYQGGEGDELDNSDFNTSGIGTHFRWVNSNEGTGADWKKVADVVITNAITPNGVQLEAKVYKPNTNTGQTASLHTLYYSISFRGRIDDSSTYNDAIVYGPDADMLRVYKTADYTFELQAKTNDDNRDLVVEVNITSKRGGKVTPTTTLVDGTLTGGTAYTATTNNTNKTKFAGDVSFTGATFDDAEIDDLRVNEFLYFGTGASSGYGPYIIHSDSGGSGKGLKMTVESDFQIWGVTGNAGEQTQALQASGGEVKLCDVNGDFVFKTITGGVQIEAGFPKLILKDTTDNDDQKIEFVNNTDGVDYLIGTQDFTAGGGGDGLYIGSKGSNEVALVTNDTTRLTIDASGTSTFTGDIKQTDSTQKYINGSYLEIGTGKSNTAQLTFNADYDGGETNTYTPNYSGNANAGMSIIKMPSGGMGGLDFYVKNHGTTSGSHNLSTFTKILELNQSGASTFNGNLTLSGGRTLFIPTHSGTEIDLTGSNAGNIRANNTLYLLSQTATVEIGASGTNSILSIQSDKVHSDQTIIIECNLDQIFTLDQTGGGWSYIGFESDGTRNFYVGQDSNEDFVIGADASSEFIFNGFSGILFAGATLNNTGNITPNTDSTYNIGTSAERYANIYADNIHGSSQSLSITSNDTFSGTYSLLWHSGETVYSSSFMTINGSTDTFNVTNISTGNLNTSGNIFVGNSNNTDNYIKVYHSDDHYSELHGYGILSDRAAYYLRPINDGTQTLYLGASDATKNWSTIQLKFSSYASFNRNGTLKLVIDDDYTTVHNKLLVNQTGNLTSKALQVNGYIDITNVGSTALRWYDGSTFRGGLGTNEWALSGSAADLSIYVNGDNSFFTIINNSISTETYSEGLKILTTTSKLVIDGSNYSGLNIYSPSNAHVNVDSRDFGSDGAALHKYNRNNLDNAYRAYYERWYDGSNYYNIGVEGGKFKVTTTLATSGSFEADGDIYVVGSGYFGSTYRTRVTGSSSGAYIEFGTSSNPDSLGVLGAFASSMIFSTGQSLGHKWQISGQTKMRLTTGGDLSVGGDFAPSYTLHVDGDVRADQIILENYRVSGSQEYPVGHYTGGKEVWSFDTTWSNLQLQQYFDHSNVEWYEDTTAPGGWAIAITGGVSVGGNYSSGFPYIPVDDDAIYYMECYIRSWDGAQRHYMGSIDYNESFGSLGGNPGSFGYWVMSNTQTSTTWQKVSGYITGFGTAIGTFKSGTKYWTPQALFNYSQVSGTRKCVISGWRVIRMDKQEFFSSGLAATPSISFAKDQNSGMYSPGNDKLGLTVGGSRKIYIESGGVRIQNGTFSVVSNNQIQTLNGTTYLNLIYQNTTNNNLEIGQDSTTLINDVQIKPGVSGMVKLLGSQSGTKLNVDTAFNNAKIEAYDSGVCRIRLTSGANDVGMTLAESGSDKWNIFSASGTLHFRDTNQTTSKVELESDGDLILRGGRIVVRETDDGNDAVEISSDASKGFLRVKNGGTNYVSFRGDGDNFIRTDSTSEPFFRWYYGISQVGSIVTNMYSTIYNTTSDYRLKENVTDITNALDRVDNLKPKRFNFKTYNQTVDGFIAHEVADVVPEAVVGEKDAIDENGNPEYQGIDQSKLVPLLVASIKELRAELNLLKSKINS